MKKGIQYALVWLIVVILSLIIPLILIGSASFLGWKSADIINKIPFWAWVIFALLFFRILLGGGR